MTRNYDGPDVDLEVEVRGEKIQVTAHWQYNRTLDIFFLPFRIGSELKGRALNVYTYGHPDFDPDFYADLDRAVTAAVPSWNPPLGGR